MHVCPGKGNVSPLQMPGIHAMPATELPLSWPRTQFPMFQRVGREEVRLPPPPSSLGERVGAQTAHIFWWGGSVLHGGWVLEVAHLGTSDGLLFYGGEEELKTACCCSSEPSSPSCPPPAQPCLPMVVIARLPPGE